MSFLETDRLPETLEAGSGGGPRFFTTKRPQFDGRVKRFINWSQPRQIYDVGYAFRYFSDPVYPLQAVINLFYAAKGSFNGFRYLNHIDNTIPWDVSGDNKQQIALGDGASNVFQIFKSYVTNSGQFDRLVNKIVSGSDRAWIEATELTRVPSTPGAGEYCIDTTTAQITTGDIPASTGGTGPGGEQIVFIQCRFDDAVRFDQDNMDIQMEGADTGAESGSIPRIPLIGLKVANVAPNFNQQIDTSFLESDRLPQYVGSLSGGARWKTTLRVLHSGFEKRYEDWLNTRGEWTLSFGLHDLTRAGNPIRDLIDLFYVAMGGGRGFRFEDPQDHNLVNEQIGVGDGSTTVFQATKTYQTLSGVYIKPIIKPSAQFQAFVDDVPVASTTDETNGQVTLAAAAGNGLSVKVTGPFDLPVNFDDDEIKFSIEASENDESAALVGRVRLIEQIPVV